MDPTVITIIVVILVVVIGWIAWWAFKYFMIRKQRQDAILEYQQKINRFEEWRKGRGIQKSKVLGGYSIYGFYNIEGLMIDFPNRKWCKVLTCLSFDFSEIAGVEISKNYKRESIGAHSSSRSSKNFRSSSTYTTKDLSTYTVLIKTTDLTNSLVSIHCETNHALAEEIKATVKNMMKDGKAAAKQVTE